jgi:hypothetical protein
MGNVSSLRGKVKDNFGYFTFLKIILLSSWMIFFALDTSIQMHRRQKYETKSSTCCGQLLIDI